MSEFALKTFKGSDIASAATVSPDVTKNRFDITGTTGITTIQTGAREVGALLWLRFTGALTITHDGSNLVMKAAGNASYTTTAGDLLLFEVIGTNQVRCEAILPAALMASQSYVDALIRNLDFKASVRAATVVAGTLASSFENGDTVDGVVLATGDRILIKDQASGGENGIYVVASSGAPTRAVDADSNSEVTPGLRVLVEEGTANADKEFKLTNNGAIVVGTTALVFAEHGAASSGGSTSGAAELYLFNNVT